MYSRRTMSRGDLPLKCNDDELRLIVEKYIEQSDYDFTFNGLIHYIKQKAMQMDLFEKEDNVEYIVIELNRIDIKRINLLIWDMIWDRKIIIDFSKDKAPGYDDCRFMKVD